MIGSANLIERLATIAQKAGNDPRQMVLGLLAIGEVFDAQFGTNEDFVADLTHVVAGLRRTDPREFVRATIDI